MVVCRIFFANLTGVATYFHNSTSCTNVVDNIVGKRIPQFVQTRWSSRSKILHTIVNEWFGFINVFDFISKDPKSTSESICGAIGHLKNLKTFEFAFLALPEFLKLFNQAVSLKKPPKTTRNESNIQLNFKTLFYEIIDNILMQLNTRFQDTNKLLFLQLADVTKFNEYSSKFPENALNNLKSTYSNIFSNINTLKVEFEVFYSDIKYQNLLHIYEMVKIIEQDALKDILPEAYKLFILILTLPSTSVSNERSFSCLKRIKTCSRNSISQVRLSSLSMLSIEKSLIHQLKEIESFYNDIIQIYASQKDRISFCFKNYTSNNKLVNQIFYVNRSLTDVEIGEILKKMWKPEPTFEFPNTVIFSGKDKRSKNLKFQYRWLHTFPWLAYSAKLDGAFCTFYVAFAKSGASINSQTPGALVKV
ncbi:hypothetical protein AGLY_016585 [Aphis glycines]|uniref:HAT C-terminal dimerisation domain-containing protein n=1 Tax=Aphis glycines TaxID=307491 RepID=A0A6G0SYB9_APHGL|nr:hypothetical protein AGLY_016585 [Aphis glycines]